MNRVEFQELMDRVYAELLSLNNTKGHDYAGDNDAFANFKRNGERLGLDPILIWAVYFNKHVDAIETYVRESGVKSEPIEGRIKDAILYLFLLYGMVYERDGK